MMKPELQSKIQAAVARLHDGGVVAFPTETVYGLGADATNSAAVRRVFEIKGRPADHPMIVHLADESQLANWAREVPSKAKLLARRFWPGPLTLILPRSHQVSNVITGGQDTVGLRVPDHPIALALIRGMGNAGGLAAPSANHYGRISPTTAAHVQEEFGDEIDMIIDGGSCQVGLESTIVSCIDNIVKVLRPGGVPLPALEEVLQQKIEVFDSHQSNIRVSGSSPSHYAPNTPLEICSSSTLWNRVSALGREGKRVATLEWSAPYTVHLDNLNVRRTAMPANPVAYGQLLYATLRQLDDARFDRLMIEAPPATAPWLAVADRLQRASYPVYCPV